MVNLIFEKDTLWLLTCSNPLTDSSVQTAGAKGALISFELRICEPFALGCFNKDLIEFLFTVRHVIH